MGDSLADRVVRKRQEVATLKHQISRARGRLRAVRQELDDLEREARRRGIALHVVDAGTTAHGAGGIHGRTADDDCPTPVRPYHR